MKYAFAPYTQSGTYAARKHIFYNFITFIKGKKMRKESISILTIFLDCLFDYEARTDVEINLEETIDAVAIVIARLIAQEYFGS